MVNLDTLDWGIQQTDSALLYACEGGGLLYTHLVNVCDVRVRLGRYLFLTWFVVYALLGGVRVCHTHVSHSHVAVLETHHVL